MKILRLLILPFFALSLVSCGTADMDNSSDASANNQEMMSPNMLLKEKGPPVADDPFSSGSGDFIPIQECSITLNAGDGVSCSCSASGVGAECKRDLWGGIYCKDPSKQEETQCDDSCSCDTFKL